MVSQRVAVHVEQADCICIREHFQEPPPTTITITITPAAAPAAAASQLQ